MTPSKEIGWVAVNGLLIADQCLLTNVSWDDLDVQGLVFGKEVTVQGLRFKIRLLKVGSKEDVPNEWDAALDAVGEDDTLWHWDHKFFWGQEPVSGSVSHRAIRGYTSARHYRWSPSSTRNAYCGFRPVLVPLNTKQFTPALLGQRVMIWGGQNIVNGYLEQVTDYDVLLSNWHGSVLESQSCGWIITGGKLLVDRNSIVGAQNQKEA